MKYTIGTPIADEDILRRFKDEDNDIFIEVRGMPEALFRVTEGNRVYYKIEKSKMQNDELILLDDNSWIKPKPQPQWDDVEMEIPFSADDFIIEEDSTDLREGSQLPEHLKSQCKPTAYGGYSFHYEKFLYMLDSNYRIEIKTPDAFSKYDFEPEPVGESPKSTEPDTVPEINSDWGMVIEFYKDDTLPPYLRTQCEAEIGSGGGSRITIGDYLYILNAQYRVIQKMKISYFDDGSDQSTVIATVDKNEKLTDNEIVDNLVKTFEIGLMEFNISADFFRESVLGISNREILTRAYHGDLSALNDDIRDAAARGEITTLKEKGFNLFKSVLIHELYINTTLAGRGDKMKYFLTYVIASEPNGVIGNLIGNLPIEDQKKIVDYFGKRADFYTDKTDIIKRVYRNIRGAIFEQYKELWYSRENVLFKALVLAKFYENTTRLDRGNGITMIRLSRDIIAFGEQ